MPAMVKTIASSSKVNPFGRDIGASLRVSSWVCGGLA
jgi:hypothetical protein